MVIEGEEEYKGQRRVIQQEDQISKEINSLKSIEDLYCHLFLFDQDSKLQKCQFRCKDDNKNLITTEKLEPLNCGCKPAYHLQCFLLRLKHNEDWQCYCQEATCLRKKDFRRQADNVHYQYEPNDFRRYFIRSRKNELAAYWAAS